MGIYLSVCDFCKRFNKIGAEGAKAIVDALKKNSTLMTLNLGINDIGDDGVKMMKEGLEANSSLTALGLRYNHVGNGGARMIQEALLTNTTLTALYGVDEIRVSEEHFGTSTESPNSSKAEHKCPDSSDKQE